MIEPNLRFVRYAMGKKFHNARLQARFRDEPWELDRETYIDLWLKDNAWQRMGRDSDSLSMTRIDPELGWSVDNVEIVVRSTIVRRPKKKT